MLLNDKETNISTLTIEKVNVITPLTNPDEAEDGEDETVCYETDAVLDIEGTAFKPSYEYEWIDGEAELRTIYLKAAAGGESVLEVIHEWKDRLLKKYECEIWDEDTGSSPDYSIEFGYEDDDDHWTVRMESNAYNFDYDLRIDIE